MSDQIDLFQRLSVALAIGLLIGLERGWRGRSEREGERAAGLRTHALAGLLGGVWGAIALRADSGGVVALGLAFVAFSAVIAAYRLREIIHDQSFGATTVVAAMLAFALGAFAVVGDVQAAAACGVAATLLLALKSVLHAWLQRLTWEELRSVLVLLAMTFVLLPLLPDRAVDRWGVLNPHALWLMTILIAALSFAGYVAIKVTGEKRGILLTGIAGGLVSSTAVTLSLARLARDEPARSRLPAAGILAAGATMLVRVTFLAGVLNTDVLVRIGPPLLAAAFALALLSAILARRAWSQAAGKGLELRNPFDLSTVLKFGALLTAITVAARLAAGGAGEAGAYVVVAVSGLADVDAIALSMSRLGGTILDAGTAANAILIAVAVNTVAKTVMGWMTGGSACGRWLALGALLALGAGGIALLVASPR